MVKGEKAKKKGKEKSWRVRRKKQWREEVLKAKNIWDRERKKEEAVVSLSSLESEKGKRLNEDLK
jgi:hypothetical protein